MAPQPAAAVGRTSPPPAHVLLLPLPFQGHITVFVELGNRLAASGLRVTILTTQHVHAKLLRSQALLQQSAAANAAPTDHPRPAHLLSFAYLPDSLPDKPLSHELLQATETNLDGAALEFVLSLAAEGRAVTCIISDFFLRSSLASRTGLPEFVLVVHCLSFFAMYLQIDAFIAVDFDLFKTVDRATAGATAGATGPDPMESVEGVAGLPRGYFRYADVPFQDSTPKTTVAWLEQRIKDRMKAISSYRGFLVNSCADLEGEVYNALLTAPGPHVDVPQSNLIRMIGPLLPSSPGETRGSSLLEEEVDECMHWLDRQPARSVVYVAFGSLARLGGDEQLKELARGLIDSGHRFLWVLREDSTSLLGGRSESSVVALEIVARVKQLGVGKVVTWAPQVRVLSHVAVGGFFSHCGWNSVLESIQAGVSILGWPYMADHFQICRLVTHVWKMGLELKRGPLNETTSLDVSLGVRELMQGSRAPLMRSNASKLRTSVQEASDSSSEFIALVEAITESSN